MTSSFFFDVEDVLGERGQLSTIGRDGDRYSALLYDAFPIRILVDRGTGRLAIELEEASAVLEPAASQVSALGVEQLGEALAVIDRHARAALPAKYLQRYDAAYQVGPLGR